MLDIMIMIMRMFGLIMFYVIQIGFFGLMISSMDLNSEISFGIVNFNQCCCGRREKLMIGAHHGCLKSKKKIATFG